MKETMIEMMISMMPVMKPFMWSGVAIAILGLLLYSGGIILKSNTSIGIRWMSRLIAIMSMFFIGAQITGYFLGMPPKINLGDSTKFEFILIHFWQIGLVFLVIAMLLRYFGNQIVTIVGTQKRLRGL